MPPALPLAIQTAHSVGEGSARPPVWRPVLEALHRPAGDEETGRRAAELDETAAEVPWRVLLADRDDLTALPEAIAAFGRERVAVGALVRLAPETAGDADVLLAAPTAEAYGRLCRFLSQRHEEPDRLADWLGRGLGVVSPRLAPDLGGVVALVRNVWLGRVLADAGAAVRWRCDRRPDDAGAGTGSGRGSGSGAGDWPALALPLVSHPGIDQRRGEPVRQALARMAGSSRRGGRERDLRTGLLGADELPAVAAAFANRLDLVLAGHELLASCTYVPGGSWHMPPSDHEDAEAELRRRASAGIRWRYGAAPAEAVRRRLDHELAVIGRKGFAGYVLTVHDLAAGRRTCGRGSAASSLVCFALGITNVDPLRYGLVFERFLADSRTDPPDIDVDFPWDERDEVLAGVIARYGREHVAMVATHTTLRRDGALRQAARAYGLGRDETTAAVRALAAARRYRRDPGLGEPWPLILDAAGHLAGMPLQFGVHPGGTVITPEPIRELVPVHPAAKTVPVPGDADTAARAPVPVIAWEKDGAEELGLVKIDLLGNRSLAVIRDAVADLAEDGLYLDEGRWRPAEDPLTRALVAAGDTLGCFYIESPAMRQLQARAGSGEFDRLVVHSSIIRPAANRWIATYLERLHHVRRTGAHDPGWYPHPILRGLLSETFGVLSYQEDVMLVARELAGFDERGANALRKALGHWDTGARLLRHRQAFLAGAQARGVPAEVAEQVWQNIASFSGYSFAKAHSASYAMVSFQCAWLKAHHPAHFLAAVIANEGGFYEPLAYAEEARRRGLRILGPCLVHSGWRTRRESADAIRIGLHLVPGVGRALADSIARERQTAPFAGLADAVRRCRIPPRLLDLLVRVGACDALRPELHRDHLRWLAQAIALDRLHRHRDEPPGTQWLFPRPPCDDPPVPDLPPPDRYAAAWARFRALGLCPEAHPIRFALRPDACRAADLARARHGERLWISGWPVTRKQVSTHPEGGDGDGRQGDSGQGDSGPSNSGHGHSDGGPGHGHPAPGGRRAGEAMAFVTLDDETGMIEAILFPEAFRTVGALLDRGAPVRVHGTVQVDHGVRTLVIDRGEPLAFRPGLDPMPACAASSTCATPAA